MLVHATWPEYRSSDLVDDESEREMNWVIDLIEQIRSIRAELRVPAGVTIPVSFTDLDQAGQKSLDNNAAMIRRLARTEEISRRDQIPDDGVTVSVNGGTFCLELSDVIDMAAERKRLMKSRQDLERDLEKLRSRLSDERFVANAPEHIVDEQRARIEAADEELSRLNEAIKRVMPAESIDA